MRLPQYEKRSAGQEDFGDKIMKTPQTKDIGEMLQEEVKRCLGLLSQYASQGPGGLHDHTMISEHITVANEAMIARDLPQMTISLKILEGCKYSLHE